MILAIEAHNHRLCSFFPLCCRSVGSQEQQHRHRKHWGRKARDPRGPSRGFLEVFAPPQPTTVPQVQHFPRQRRAVRSVHPQGSASLTCSGTRRRGWILQGHLHPDKPIFRTHLNHLGLFISILNRWASIRLKYPFSVMGNPKIYLRFITIAV